MHYKGLLIQQNEDGFFARNGCWSMGYCDTIEEICAEIDWHFAQEAESLPPHDDSPSLPEPWWTHP